MVRDQESWIFFQSHYIEKFNHYNCVPVLTPFDPSMKSTTNDGNLILQLEYARIIKCLMYAMSCTIVDIASMIGKLSRCTSSPRYMHWHEVKRVLKYLKETINYGISYCGYLSVLERCIHARLIPNSEDHSSASEWAFMLGGGMVAWDQRKKIASQILLQPQSLWHYSDWEEIFIIACSCLD